jgi:hypothetical protein
MINDFNIRTDIQVEMFLPNEYENTFIIGVSTIGGTDLLSSGGVFTIGISLIGGSDVLSDGSVFDWQQIQCETSKADISTGGTVISAFYFQPEAATCSIEVQSWAFDPNNSSAVRPGTPMRIRLVKDDYEQTLFNGFLDTFTVTYRADGPNLISFQATDSFKRLVNTPVFDYDTTGYPAGYATPNELIEIATDAAGMIISASSDVLPGKLPLASAETIPASSLINDSLQVGLGLVWVDAATGELVVRNRPTAGVTPAPGTLVIGNNHGEPNHLCMSDITSEGDADVIFNSILVSITSDPDVFVSVSDPDSVELYGFNLKDIAINTTDTTELTRWADAVFTQRPYKLVRSVTTPAIDRLGTLTEAAAILPGELVGVQYQTTNINIEDYFTATKVSHSLDVDNWFTTLELWKEY